MYIPKFKIVDACDLANEYEIDWLTEHIHEYHGNFNQLYIEDHIRSWKDDDWFEIPDDLKWAYHKLCTDEGFKEGEIFIWRL